MRRSTEDKEIELKSIEQVIDKKLEARKNYFFHHEIVSVRLKIVFRTKAFALW